MGEPHWYEKALEEAKVPDIELPWLRKDGEVLDPNDPGLQQAQELAATTAAPAAAAQAPTASDAQGSPTGDEQFGHAFHGNQHTGSMGDTSLTNH